MRNIYILLEIRNIKKLMRQLNLICRENLFFNNVSSLKYDAIIFKISFLPHFYPKSYKYNLRHKKYLKVKHLTALSILIILYVSNYKYLF